MHQKNSLMVAGALAALQLSLGFRPDYWIFGLLALAREVFLDSPIPKITVPQLEPAPNSPVNTVANAKGKRICVVTGGAGYVGQHLIAGLLEEGKYDVIRALDVVGPKVTDPRVESIKGDILSIETLVAAFEGAEVVFHVASLISLREEPHRRYAMSLVNVVGAQNVINACVRCGVQRLVYTSSAAVVYDGRKGKCSERDYVERPPSPGVSVTYAKTKA